MPALEPPEHFREAIGLMRVVDQNGSPWKCRLEPMPDAKVRTDEDECSAYRPAAETRPNQLDRIALDEHARRPESAPQPHRMVDAKRLVHLDRAPVAASVRIPQRVDEMDNIARRGACHRDIPARRNS